MWVCYWLSSDLSILPGTETNEKNIALDKIDRAFVKFVDVTLVHLVLQRSQFIARARSNALASVSYSFHHLWRFVLFTPMWCTFFVAASDRYRDCVIT